MSDLVLVYVNVNEEGDEYDWHTELEPALAMLRSFPNDHIIVKLEERK